MALSEQQLAIRATGLGGTGRRPWTEYDLTMLVGWYRWCRDNGALPTLATIMGRSVKSLKHKASSSELVFRGNFRPRIDYIGRGLSSLPERITSKIDKTGTCWIWTGQLNQGYGHARINGRKKYVHRIVYEALIGLVTSGLELDHAECQNKACCNPDHLEEVTHIVNVRRGLAGRRMSERTHCPRGHEYSEENTYRNNGRRHCRACRRKRC